MRGKVKYSSVIPYSYIGTRNYSTYVEELVDNNHESSPIQLDPWFVTGFVYAEGSFVLHIRQNSKSRSGWEVIPIFSISMHEKDLPLLEAIKAYFGGIGRISKHGASSYSYVVTSKKQLTIILDHFYNYGLITQKLADYLLLKMGF